MKWLEEVNKESFTSDQILSFDEYMQLFNKNPRRECRTSCIYLKDMFDYFSKNEQHAFHIFTNSHPSAPPVHGQQIVQQEIYQNILNFIEEGYNNKFLLLVGPNGSAKSSLIKKIMLGAEDYSKLDDGALFSFSWIFPIDHFVKGSLGLGKGVAQKELTSYSKLEDHEISAILPSELKDHPLLLIPIKARQRMINQSLQDFPKILESIRKSYLYNGDLSKRNRMIFDSLLKNYKGDFKEVYKHIRVERFSIDKRYSIGAATIEPQMHVDARLQQITMDKRLGSLPPSLQSLNLFSVQGEIVLSNRGILEYSDLLKRPLDTYKYLLMTMESQSINLHGILTELDIFFIGSSNEIHFAAFKQHPDFNSFKGRFNFVKVPYLLNYRYEQEIYKDQIGNIQQKSNFEPHALESICLWSIMTRLRASQAKNFKEKKLGKLSESLNPLEKTLFIADDVFPENFDTESKQILKQGKTLIESEFFNDPLYEGKFGISPREIKQLIYELAQENKVVTFIDVVDYLKILSEKKLQYDFLNIAAHGDYHNSPRCIELIEHYELNKFDHELRDSLGLIDDRSYEDYIKRYISNVTALIKGDKIKNPVTGKSEPSDMYFIREFENNINLKEDAENFRSHMISRIGAYSLDNPGKKLKYTDVFEDLVNKLQESFRNEQKKMIQKIAQNIVYFEEKKTTGQSSSINKDSEDLIQSTLDNLLKKHTYSEQGAMRLIKLLIKRKYENVTS
jgi:predicted Ser/Thr protein kinase